MLRFQPPPPYVSEPPVLAASAPLPTFHQRTSDSQRFGFLAPPATEQASNTPYDSSRPLSRQPSMLDVRDRMPSQPLYGRSSITDSQIDPALRSNPHLPSVPSARGYDVDHRSDVSMGSGKTSESSSKSSDDEHSDGGEHSDTNGWGSTNRREVAHAGTMPKSLCANLELTFL